LQEFNDTKVDFPKDKTIVDLFEEQVKKTPNNIAVVFNKQELTYSELNERSNQLAEYLRNHYSVKPNDLVALKLGRSENLLIAIFGILKSGAAYVPMDTNYPKRFIEYIEKDSNAKLVINQSFFEAFQKEKGKYTKENTSSKITRHNLAYVIYTSGTTGNPKGVMITHGNTAELLHWAKQEFNPERFNIVYSSTSHCFDISVYEMFYPLTIGKKIRILNNALEIEKSLKNDTEVLINTVPSSIRSLIDNKVSLENANIINLAGESFPVDVGNRLVKTKVEVRNLYGPSEDTTYSTIYKLNKDKNYTTSIPIGKPISNTKLYILDDHLELVPIGVSGKLYISGDGMAKGYLNREELTKEKFIANPYEKGQRMYDTGDAAMWLADGNVAFLGRKDHQIKLRGYRIELGEIENSILSYSESISQAVALVKNETLVVYYTVKNTTDKDDLKNHLRTRLPNYMVPGHFELMESIPLAPNGKIDREKLESLSIDYRTSSNYIAPRNETERQLTEIWQEVLGIEKVGIQENFFELGGHSLMIAQVINQIYKQLNGNITYKEFFQNPVPEAIAKTIKRKSYVSIPKAKNQEYYPLVPSQHRIWVLSQLDEGSQAYIMSGAVLLK
ncbi:amino acid adenylation domain-containing protein, partial [Croceitalea marina]